MITKFIIKDDSAEFDLHHLFNSLSMMTVNTPPLANQQSNQTLQQLNSNKKLLASVKNVQQVEKLLRLTAITQTEKAKMFKTLTHLDITKSNFKSSKKAYIRPTHNPNTDQKVFWMVKDSFKSKLKLDDPKFVICLPNQYILAIQRKCISLYETDGNEIELKDYDSASIGKKTSLVQVKHVNFRGNDYIIIFGNDKEGSKSYFGASVYQIIDSHLIFIKKQIVWNSEVSSPVILFDTYPKNQAEKFCLIIGGYTDNRQTYNYHALQINLYLLTQENISILPHNTVKIEFSSKIQILAGKAIEFNDYWYAFSSQNQQLTQMKLRYQQGGILTLIDVQSQQLSFGEKIYFCEDNLHMGFKGAQHMIVMLNRNIEFRFKVLDEVLKKFKYF